MKKILTIKNLNKKYHTKSGEIEAIKDISFDLYDQEFLTIVGSSGCGKSTLLNILADLDTKTSGDIIMDTNLKIGYMLQEDALLPWLNILDNACIGLDINNIKTKENVEYVKSLLTKYGLKDFLKKYPEQLSGGMRQRVSLIRTLALKPDILMLDEPFSALDYVSRLSVSDDVANIIKSEGKTVIMITHDVAEACSLSSRVIVLSKRPSKIKKIYTIKYENPGTPMENRRKKEFLEYYDSIWKDLDKNV